MLALWSRVARSPGTCRCISCVSIAKTAARRHGLRGSWALGTPTSTFLYTAAFAAALSIDAKAKSDRNIQWEEAFAQLREALDRPPSASQTARKTRETAKEEADWRNAQRAAAREVKPNAALHEHDALQSDATERIWADLRLDSRPPGAETLAWPANTGQNMVPYNLPPQSLWAPDELRLSAMRRRHTRKKLAMQELATGFLIHNLVKHVHLGPLLKSDKSTLDRLAPHIRQVAMSTDAEAEEARLAFLKDIETLHKTHVSTPVELIASARKHVEPVWVPRYHQDADGDFHEICKQMNDSITQLLREGEKIKPKEKALTIAKVCHNLLVSSVAPDLHTYNILIANFKLWGRVRLVDDVIAAFFASKVRPNELLCAQVLNHYTTQARADDFTRFVAKMRGVGDALTLADPDITVSEVSEGRLLRVNDDKVLQKVYPTPMVFSALIQGVLKFAGFDRALDVYYEMKADGWGLSVPGLTRLLADCVRRADWEGGTYVWEEINSIKSKVKPHHVARAYHHMLSLCSVSGNTVAFNQVLNEVAKRGFNQKSIIEAAMQTTLWAQRRRENLAPAWAADNLMIAVSGYMNGTKSSKIEVDDLPSDDMEFDDASFEQQASENGSVATLEQTGVSNFPGAESTKKKEAWSSWVEHEFGKRPKDPKI
jgi:hypothetical protein